MNWHLFSIYGLGGHTTDPGEEWFTQRVKAEMSYVNVHDSPYRDYETSHIATLIDALPAEDGVFVVGTSLGANDAPIVCGWTKHIIDGCFGFQASEWGVHSSLTENVRFAALFYSYNPIPFPLLGAYIWHVGTMNRASFHPMPKHLPHPGDYDVPSQNTYLAIMKRIIANPGR